MPVHMTKIAFRSESVESLRHWLESHDSVARLTTKNRPTRYEEMVGGSLYWIHQHAIVGRSPILGFEKTPEGRWWIELAPELVGVKPKPKRAHQGWRYLKEEDAPRDLEDGEDIGDVLPGKLMGKLSRLGLV
ncbi:DUF1489 family protein [Altererythrobacter confluentis]|uniref:DUF1489 family protein n=1 Tax=Allopontixanthobacter confluentis TaxID=1849021 RepID=A0A6L7GGX3_9SPHN|nr:DUF1489 domain-containing protein [Allopontixanthobacter confluentis]MXP14554.1 DUF1489 family protein [Allopontixanthobacter confluentis]